MLSKMATLMQILKSLAPDQLRPRPMKRHLIILNQKLHNLLAVAAILALHRHHRRQCLSLRPQIYRQLPTTVSLKELAHASATRGTKKRRNDEPINQ